MSESVNTTYTRFLLRTCREEAKALGVEIPKNLTTWADGFGYMEVWANGGIVWWGSADNSYHAKAMYISQLIDDAEAA